MNVLFVCLKKKKNTKVFVELEGNSLAIWEVQCCVSGFVFVCAFVCMCGGVESPVDCLPRWPLTLSSLFMPYPGLHTNSHTQYALKPTHFSVHIHTHTHTDDLKDSTAVNVQFCTIIQF